MPEFRFSVKLPDGEVRHCYSPSSVVTGFFRPGETLCWAEFLSRSQTALRAAQERVRQRYGLACSSAAEEAESLEKLREKYAESASVDVVELSPWIRS
jgi:uncharacterized repeat protein (TIGR04042 family)